MTADAGVGQEKKPVRSPLEFVGQDPLMGSKYFLPSINLLRGALCKGLVISEYDSVQRALIGRNGLSCGPRVTDAAHQGE